MARPLTEIDWDVFDQLMFFGATLRECSWWFNCSEDTIERAVTREKQIGFAEYQQQKAVKCKISLRRRIIEKALNGDNTMLIWASKNMLDWSDKLEQKHQVEGSIEIQTIRAEVKKILGDPNAMALLQALEKQLDEPEAIPQPTH